MTLSTQGPRPPRRPRARRGGRSSGFVFIDAAIAIALIGVVTAGIVMAMGRYNRAAHKFGDTRRAALAAEAVMTDLQFGRPAAAGARVTRLDAPAPPGRAWVEVVVADGVATGSLIGLVPASVPASGPATAPAPPANGAPRDGGASSVPRDAPVEAPR